METALQILANFAAFMFVASLKGSVLIVLVLAAQKLFGTMLPANWRYALWFIVVISLVTPVGYEAALLPPASGTELSSSSTLGAAIESRASERENSVSVADASPRIPKTTNSRVEMPSSLESLPSVPAAILPLLWLAGVITVLCAIARSGNRFAQLVQRARPASDALHAVLSECAALTDCRSPVALLLSDDVGVPIIAHQLNPILLLPTGLERQLTQAQLRHVFIHELMHLQRGDIAANWVVALVQALHWFNPLAWYAFMRMRQDRELACDAATLRHLSDAETAAYGHTLLQLNDRLPALRMPTIALGMLHDSSPLHQRIRMLAQPPRMSLLPGTAATVAMLPLVALAFSQPVPTVREQLPNVDTVPVIVDVTPAASAPQPEADVFVPATSVAVEESPGADLTTATAQQEATVSSTPATPEHTTEAPPTTQREFDAAPQSTPVVTDIAATAMPATSVLAAVNTALEATPTAPYAGLAEIERMADTLTTIKAGKLAFIEKWNDVGTACDAHKERFLGALSASCQRIRTAQRRGEIFRFAYECYQLNTIHEELTADYREAATQQREPRAEDALRNNARDLAAICSEDTYASQYPAFATMFADAEALKYYPHRPPNASKERRTFASFGDVFFDNGRAGGNTGLGTGGTAYSPGFPTPDAVVPGIFGSGIPAGEAVVVPTQ